MEQLGTFSPLADGCNCRVQERVTKVILAQIIRTLCPGNDSKPNTSMHVHLAFL